MSRRPSDLDLAARFVQALYAATSGKPGQFRRIDDCAYRAGLTKAAAARAVKTAEAAGFLVVRVDEPLVMLTREGREAAKPTPAR